MRPAHLACRAPGVGLLGPIGGLILLILTATPAASQQVMRAGPEDSMRVGGAIDPAAATVNSRRTLQIRIRQTNYDLRCTTGPEPHTCAVAPNVVIDKTDRDVLMEKGTSFRLGVCSDMLGSCRRGVRWFPAARNGETALEGTGVVSPGAYYLSWTINSYPDAAVSNLLTFRSPNPAPIRK